MEAKKQQNMHKSAAPYFWEESTTEPFQNPGFLWTADYTVGINITDILEKFILSRQSS